MEYHVIPHSLPGHPDCKSIRIIYNIPPGIQVLQRTGLTGVFVLLSDVLHCHSQSDHHEGPLSFQGPEHPNPGKPFTARGFPRHCYLPDSEKGRKVNPTHCPVTDTYVQLLLTEIHFYTCFSNFILNLILFVRY